MSDKLASVHLFGEFQMHMRNVTRSIASALLVCLSAYSCPTSSAEGWFQKSTGIKTPEPIRKIAPDGLSIGKGEQSTSGFGHVEVRTIPPYIDSNGNVWSGNENSTKSNRIVAKATIRHNEKGDAYWFYRGPHGSPSSVRKREFDRSPARPELLGREAKEDIEFDNQVQKKKVLTQHSSGTQNVKPQNGLTKQQQEQAALANAIGQLIQGISQNADQNRPQNSQGIRKQSPNSGQRQWGQRRPQ